MNTPSRCCGSTEPSSIRDLRRLSLELIWAAGCTRLGPCRLRCGLCLPRLSVPTRHILAQEVALILWSGHTLAFLFGRIPPIRACGSLGLVLIIRVNLNNHSHGCETAGSLALLALFYSSDNGCLNGALHVTLIVAWVDLVPKLIEQRRVHLDIR